MNFDIVEWHYAWYMDSGMLYKMTISLIPKSENKAKIAGATWK